MLDTRLKNSYNFILRIIIVCIFVFSIAITLLYPNLEKIGVDYQSKKENLQNLEKIQANELSKVMINATMALTGQIREARAGKLLSNEEAYIQVDVNEEILKKYEDEYELYMEIINEFIVRSNGWKQSYNTYRNYFTYEVKDTSTKEDLLFAIGLDYKPSKNTSKLVLSYDSGGKMTIEELDIKGSMVDVEAVSNEFRKALDVYRAFNPLDDYNVYLSQSEEDIKHEFKLTFKPPKNLSFTYYFDSEQIFGVNSVIYTHRFAYYYNYILAALLLVALTGIALSFIKDYSDKSDKTNLPFELLVFIIIGIYGLSGSWVLAELIKATLNNNLSDFLFDAGFFKVLAKGLIIALNVLVWLVLLGATLFVSLSVSAIFHIGPKRFLLERTLIGWLIARIKEVYRYFIQMDVRVNWNDSAFRQFGKLIGLNLLVLLVMSMFHVNNFFGLLIYSLFILAIVANYYNRKKEHFQKIINWMDTLARGELFFEEKSAVEADPNKKVYVNEDLGEFEPFDERLRLINDGFIKAVDKERESQSSKSELITNMSHDLKTPLTAIIMYINLLKDENISNEDRSKYIDILDAKSMRFKSLIDDLFEMSLASTGKLRLEKANVDIVGLLKGLRLEYNEKIEEAGIDFRWELPDEKCILSLDAKKTYRIFENLLVNITKYALKGSRAYILFLETTDYIEVNLTNISDIEIKDNPEKLLERFARADTSRNTPGSGLGLAIAKNLTEAQGGELFIDVDKDVFKIHVRFFKEKH